MVSLLALISWIRNPYKGNKSEVKVNRIKMRETVFMFILSLAVTVIFYFILTYFNTANIIPSTLSVTTSFIAVYLTFRRSPYFALAAIEDISYFSVIVCFAVFLINDLYGFISWLNMEKRQRL